MDDVVIPTSGFFDQSVDYTREGLKIELKRRNILSRDANKIINKALKTALYEVGEYWRVVCLPKHFYPGADARYNYYARDPKYRLWKYKNKARKSRIAGRELYFRGDLMNAALHNSKTSGTAKRVRVRIKGRGQALHPMKDWIRTDLARMTPDEVQEMKNIFHRVMITTLNERAADAVQSQSTE